MSKKRFTILFVDGTHENFDLLEQYPIEEWNGGKVRKIRDNVLYLMRGQVFTIDGKTIFTFGGGESPEKQMRIEAGCWWEREMPNIDEMNEGVQNLYQHDLQVDCIITHSPYPGAEDGSMIPGNGRPWKPILKKSPKPSSTKSGTSVPSI